MPVRIDLWKCLVLLGCAMSVNVLADSDTKPADPWAGVPAIWHRHLERVFAAEQIHDPLQSCLAAPTPQGTFWVPGQAEAYCYYHALHGDSLADLRQKFDAGGAAALDEVFRKDMLTEQADPHARNLLHFALGVFEQEGPDAPMLVSDWLNAAPDSPFAHTARGIVGVARGVRARGGAFINQTSSLSDYGVRREALAA